MLNSTICRSSRGDHHESIEIKHSGHETRCGPLRSAGWVPGGRQDDGDRTAGPDVSRPGLRVGIITNDQADELVDTVTLEGQGFAVEQVAGACSCCHFNALIGGPGQVAGRILDLDYDRHARGEAVLGWLNCRVMVISDLPSFSLDELLEEVASTLGAALERQVSGDRSPQDQWTKRFLSWPGEPGRPQTARRAVDTLPMNCRIL